MPDGWWFVHAVAFADAGGYRSWTPPLLIGASGSVRVVSGEAAFGVINLRRALPLDPPVLLALPGLHRRGVARVLSAGRAGYLEQASRTVAAYYRGLP